jgi:hypothetical protein
MDKDYLTLKRASASRPSGEWDDDDYDVLADGVIVGADKNPSAANPPFKQFAYCRSAGKRSLSARIRYIAPRQVSVHFVGRI